MDVIEKIKNKEVFDLLIEANKITEKIHGKDVSLLIMVVRKRRL